MTSSSKKLFEAMYIKFFIFWIEVWDKHLFKLFAQAASVPLSQRNRVEFVWRLSHSKEECREIHNIFSTSSFETCLSQSKCRWPSRLGLQDIPIASQSCETMNLHLDIAASLANVLWKTSSSPCIWSPLI